MPTLTPLVIRFGAMGDMVLLIPMLKLLQQRYGVPCDLVSSGSWTTPIMQRVAACGPRHLLTSRKTPYWFNRSQRELVAWLRQRPEGPVYVFETDDKTFDLLKRGRIKPAWICSLRDHPRLPGEHIAAHSLRLARSTPQALRDSPDYRADNLATPDARPQLTEDDRRDCARWLQQHDLTGRPLVLIQPGNKKTMKGGNRQRNSNVDYWPESHWAEVIAGIRRQMPAARAIICGAPSERELAEDIAARVKPSTDGVLVATNDLPIARLLALQAVAHSMISVNTGPAHSAAAMGCPEAVMFTRHAHRAADLYAPVPTTGAVKIILPSAANADPSLASITPEQVLATWRELVPVA